LRPRPSPRGADLFGVAVDERNVLGRCLHPVLCNLGQQGGHVGGGRIGLLPLRSRGSATHHSTCFVCTR
jgi:hypothetical protein